MADIIASNGITEGVELRKQRGLEIAALAIIKQVGNAYMVPSQFSPAQTKYTVRLGDEPTCDCPDYETRRCQCKHIYAVQFTLRREATAHADGSTTVVETVTVKKTRKTYKQDWPNYNVAQRNEKREFQSLLHDLCQNVGELPADANRKGPQGRRPIPLSDAIFSAAFKVYSTMSARRFTSDLCEAQAKGYLYKVPHFNSVLNVFENPAVFDVLVGLIERAALPLKSLESVFAVDSTGFAYSRFVRWFDIKYTRFTSEQQWVKLHLACGVKTNVVTAVTIKGKDAGDSPQLPGLVNSTAQQFNVDEGVRRQGIFES